MTKLVQTAGTRSMTYSDLTNRKASWCKQWSAGYTRATFQESDYLYQETLTCDAQTNDANLEYMLCTLSWPLPSSSQVLWLLVIPFSLLTSNVTYSQAPSSFILLSCSLSFSCSLLAIKPFGESLVSHVPPSSLIQLCTKLDIKHVSVQCVHDMIQTYWSFV